MKIYLDCYTCFVGQALRAARLAGADETLQYNVLQQTLELLQRIPPGANPPEIGYQMQQIVRSMIDTQDPYREVKHTSTKQALALYPKLKMLVRQSDDPLGLALRSSIAGNIIDFAFSDHTADLWGTVERVARQPYAIDDTHELRARLQSAAYVLYLADNAGETVFDRVLIEELPLPVIYAVKGGPIVNDAMVEDALAAGVDICAKIISNGAPAAGTILDLCSEAFQQEFRNAPLVIAKGQANFETLSDAGEKVFCLLQVKCPTIGAHLKAPAGSIIARQSGTLQ